ncbi:hypothetical protein MFIFM68171_08725 [Madurella fahalii]|uniref:Uncharacterized protein n=1 Tax=Madurella fahalii TaxID=1157608 RepID=A0ABQ0GL81_9PEZI
MAGPRLQNHTLPPTLL